MRAVFDFIVEPAGERYNNSKKVGDKDLILNTEVFNHQYTNREAIVKAVPTAFETDIKVGDTVVLHHNVFRRWHNVLKEEKNSRCYIDENTYAISMDQIFAYKRDGEWNAIKGFCFIQPIKSLSNLSQDAEEPLIGIVKYTDGSIEKDSLVGFSPDDEYEFIIDGKRLYRVMTQFITIKYEYQGNEEEYNPSWAESC